MRARYAREAIADRKGFVRDAQLRGRIATHVRAATAARADGSPIMQHHLMRAAELDYGELGFLA